MMPILSVVELRNVVREKLAQGNLDSGLCMIRRVVDRVCLEPINTPRVFGSKLLDDLCQEIGALNWRAIRGGVCSMMESRESVDEPQVVYVASRLHASGGHTAALADIIRCGPQARSVILITGIAGKTDHKAIQHRFDSLSNVKFEYAPRGSHFKKLDWLQNRLMTLSPKTVWLFNHHQDSVAIAAVQPDAGYILRYYHHGDHHLCLGVYLDFAEHIDMHPMGFHNCRDMLGIRDNHYLPLVVKDQGNRPEDWGFLAGSGLTTCTAASFNKIEIPYFIRYVDVVPELLHATGGKHIHIGHLSQIALFRIRRGMRKLGVPASAFVHIPFVPSVWKALHKYRVDLYVASFPYGGARTLIEAMGAGVGVVLHMHCASRLLSTFDMAYEGAFKWKNPEELYGFIRKIDAKELMRQGRLAREKYESAYREELILIALSIGMTEAAPPLQSGYELDNLQQALSVTGQVSCMAAIRRFVKRAFREWRSFIA